ncbi:MAG: HAD family hydrolase [Planctomycetes bacterium]|nr:HAD family hydrolase [Planctomycetota bacterium]
MWCGPRNISTALMRAWENRPDTFVVDEPLYAVYLATTRADHPLREEIVQRCETDWRAVVRSLTQDTRPGRTIYYQKQMSHHFLPQIERGWLADVTNCFLIREPREMLVSYLKKMPVPSFADTGYPQLQDLFRHVRQFTGQTPPVIDSRDVLTNPGRTLGLLCETLGVPFTEAMLQWPPGPRESDGLWAAHWYPEVEQTTGFGAYRPPTTKLPPELDGRYQQCREVYEELYEHRLR